MCVSLFEFSRNAGDCCRAYIDISRWIIPTAAFILYVVITGVNGKPSKMEAKPPAEALPVS